MKNYIYLQNKKNSFFYYFLEIRSRILYGIFSFCLTFLLTYYYNFELMYLFVRPFYPIHHFIFTDLTEAFYSTLQICCIYTIFFLIPYLLYQWWCFLVPSFFSRERKKVFFFLILFFFFLFFGAFLSYFSILPYFFQFLSGFEIKNALLSIELEARIFSYVTLTLKLFVVLQFLFQTPLFFYILFDYKILNPISLSEFRKFYIFFSLLLAAFFSPPEIQSQFLFSFFFLILYEYSLWVGFVIEKKHKKG